LGELAALSEPDAVATLGNAVGRELRRLAGGFDDRPVAERGEAKQVSAETTFDIDIIDLPTLRAEVRRIAAGAQARLVKAGRVARTVVIKLRHTDMSTVTRSETISAPSDDLAELAATAERLLIDPAEFGGIRLAGVAFSGLSVPHQDALFQPGRAGVGGPGDGGRSSCGRGVLRVAAGGRRRARGVRHRLGTGCWARAGDRPVRAPDQRTRGGADL